MHVPYRVGFNNDSCSEMRPPAQSNPVVWHGACQDTTAQKSVVCFRQAKAYCRFMSVRLKPKENNHCYSIGN